MRCFMGFWFTSFSEEESEKISLPLRIEIFFFAFKKGFYAIHYLFEQFSSNPNLSVFYEILCEHLAIFTPMDFAEDIANKISNVSLKYDWLLLFSYCVVAFLEKVKLAFDIVFHFKKERMIIYFL